MAFETLSARLQPVARAGLAFCKSRYGKNALGIEKEIAPTISWRPSFHMKANPALIIAAEVSDSLYPGILKIAAHDVLHHDFPISIIQVCPLDVFMADTKQVIIKQLKAHGFGIITVDDAGSAALQHSCIPLAQYLSEAELDGELKGLTPSLKVMFRRSYTTYLANEGQGLQSCGQIVEALVIAIAKGASNAGLIARSTLTSPTAEIIDALYAKNDFKAHRATLGGARDFVRNYRNIASHPARNPKQAMEKIRRCRTGFIEAIRIALHLYMILKSNSYSPRIVVT
jgi:hypothetical protein